MRSNELQTSQVEHGAAAEEALIKNYETQVELFKQERLRAMEIWPTAPQDEDQLQELYHKVFTEGHHQDAMMQRFKNQLLDFIQQTRKLRATTQEMQWETGRRSQHTLTMRLSLPGLTSILPHHRSQLTTRKTKDDLITARAKTEELTRELQRVEQLIKTKEEDVAEPYRREEKELQQRQWIFSQQEEKPRAWLKSASEEQPPWEIQMGTLQAQRSALGQGKYEAYKVHERIQMAEVPMLVKQDGVKTVVGEKAESLENKDKAIQQLIQEAAIRTRLEIDNVREQCNIGIHGIAEELSHSQMKCAVKDSHIERLKHERKALQKELDKAIRNRAEEDLERTSALHHRCLNAERMKDDMSITLKSIQSKLKKFEIDSSEELYRSQEEVQRLQGCLAAAWKDRDCISEDRLQLQQENLRLHREMDELHRTTLMVQNKARHQILQMEQDCKLKEQTFQAQMMMLEESSRSLNVDRRHLLSAQQKCLKQSKDEVTNMAKAFEAKIQHLTTETQQHKQRLYELEVQQYESQLAEYQEKSVSLQRRLTHAEQRATTATQEVSHETALLEKP
ncbi:sodium channel and clathrin linker 1-like [Nerophis ophidion]|uniref:sodium channel and clathrin linker 1-like n=1 Tax=Nerophis ophidion TaxID=159077 RepID=UPI002ADFA767|nr:sodium channel and clathrin linker 1-like [Nerophis ophidion]